MPYKDSVKARISGRAASKRHRLKLREQKYGMDAPDMRGRHNNHAKGAAHPFWSDARKLSSHGYVKIRVGRDHPLADPNGYAYEHLLVWVSAGRSLPGRDEVIHHENENKQDNRFSNLTLKKRVAHSVDHHNALPDESVRSIRESYAAKELDMPALAQKYGVPIARISRIIRGETRLIAGGPISKNNRPQSKVVN